MGTENNKRSKRRDRETLLSSVAAHILCPQTRSLSSNPVLCPQTRFPVESSLAPAEFTAAGCDRVGQNMEIGESPGAEMALERV